MSEDVLYYLMVPPTFLDIWRHTSQVRIHGHFSASDPDL